MWRLESVAGGKCMTRLAELIEEARGGEPSPAFDDWQADLAMLRYDAAVFVPGKSLREERYAERSGLRAGG